MDEMASTYSSQLFSYEQVINYSTEDFVDRVKEITNGKGE